MGGATVANLAPLGGKTYPNAVRNKNNETSDQTINVTVPISDNAAHYDPLLPVWQYTNPKNATITKLEKILDIRAFNAYLKTTEARRLFCKGSRPTTTELQKYWKFSGILHEDPEPFTTTAGVKGFQAVITVGGKVPRVPNIWLASPGSHDPHNTFQAHLFFRLMSMGDLDESYGLEDDVEMKGSGYNGFSEAQPVPGYYWQVIPYSTSKGGQVHVDLYCSEEEDDGIPPFVGHSIDLGFARRPYGQPKVAKKTYGQRAQDIVFNSSINVANKGLVFGLPHVEMFVRQ